MAGNNVISPTTFTTLLVADTVATTGGSNDSIQSLAKIAGGVPIANVTAETACYAASTANLNATYSNGTSGVGATLTNAGAMAAFSIDSVSPTINSRILIKDQTDTTQNGIYTLTTVGSGAANWVLTRATDYDSSTEIVPGTYAAITAGTVNTGLSFVEIATVATIGTDAIIFRAYIGHLPVAVGSALQSTNGCLWLQGVTTTQRDAFDNTNTLIADGMIAYNSTTGLFNFRQNGAWDIIGTNTVSGPVTSTDKAIARWNGTGGNTLQDSVVLVGDTGAVTGVLTVASGAGAIGAPAYTFTGDTDTGIWHSAANTLDFSTNALRALQIAAAPASSVNYLVVTPSATGNPLLLTAAGTDSNIGVSLVPKGTGAVQNIAGAVATPSYSFAANLNCGLWSSAANVLDFSTNSLRALQIVSSPALSVNYLAVSANIASSFPFILAAGTDSNIDVAVQGKATAGFSVLASTTGVAASAKLWNAAGTFYTSLGAGVNLANLALTLPITDATADANATTIRVPLATDGAGALTFSNRLTRYSSLTIASAAVLTLYDTPVTCIAAPGASSGIVVEHFAVELVHAGADYASGGAVYLQYGSTAHGTNYATGVAGVPAAFINGSASAMISATGQINSTTGLAATTVANAAVSITCATGNFTTGGGSLVLHIWYKIVPVT